MVQLRLKEGKDTNSLEVHEPHKVNVGQPNRIRSIVVLLVRRQIYVAAEAVRCPIPLRLILTRWIDDGR